MTLNLLYHSFKFRFFDRLYMAYNGRCSENQQQLKINDGKRLLEIYCLKVACYLDDSL